MRRATHSACGGSLALVVIGSVVLVSCSLRGATEPNESTGLAVSSTPTGDVSDDVPAPFLSRLPGSARRGVCVRVSSNSRDVRSGDFVAGDFGNYIRTWAASSHASHGGKIYWIPMYPDRSQVATILIQRRYPLPLLDLHVKSGPLSDSGDVAIYPSGIPIPSRGTWRLEANVGRNHGCFILTVKGEGKTG